jgi:hypothetical protein
LLKGSGVVTLNYGIGGKVTVSRQVTIAATKAEDGLIAKLWAGMKVKELSLFAEKNKPELLAVARKYGIVTPGASILVLSDAAAVRLFLSFRSRYAHVSLTRRTVLEVWHRACREGATKGTQRVHQEEGGRAEDRGE